MARYRGYLTFFTVFDKSRKKQGGVGATADEPRTIVQQQVKKYPGLFEVIIEETFGITGGEEVHKDGPRGLNSGFTESYFVYYVYAPIPCER